MNNLFFIFGGIFALGLGADIIVRSSINLAKLYRVSGYFIGFTVVALGTSLPEFAATLQALNVVNSLGIALGNIINNGVSINQLNIIFSDGYSLYVFGKSNGLYIAESDEYFTVMTIPPNNRLSTALSWSGINYGEMIVINSAGKTHYANINDSNIVLPSIIGITLEPSYPNPFNGAVTIPFSMDDNATGIISIFSLKGERISRITLSSSDIANGYIKWNPNNSTIASGAYYIFAESNGLTDYNKILFIK